MTHRPFQGPPFCRAQRAQPGFRGRLSIEDRAPPNDANQDTPAHWPRASAGRDREVGRDEVGRGTKRGPHRRRGPAGRISGRERTRSRGRQASGTRAEDRTHTECAVCRVPAEQQDYSTKPTISSRCALRITNNTTSNTLACTRACSDAGPAGDTLTLCPGKLPYGAFSASAIPAIATASCMRHRAYASLFAVRACCFCACLFMCN